MPAKAHPPAASKPLRSRKSALQNKRQTPQNKTTGDLSDLLAIMQRLRAPGGCPWDREQTLESIGQYLIEECYEVIDALETGDPAKHAEELGDLLLQIVFHAQIRQERAEFNFADVVAGLCSKLVRRHPHVFNKLRVADSAEVLKNWDAIKAKEKTSTSKNAAAVPPSLIGNIPRHMPALHKAHHVQKRVARAGFDWTEVEGTLAKIEEELREVREATAKRNPAKIKEEIGDLLFSVANLSRFQGINPEEALNQTVQKFMRRFHAMETRLAEKGRKVTACSLAELDATWNEVKANE